MPDNLNTPPKQEPTTEELIYNLRAIAMDLNKKNEIRYNCVNGADRLAHQQKVIDSLKPILQSIVTATKNPSETLIGKKRDVKFCEHQAEKALSKLKGAQDD